MIDELLGRSTLKTRIEELEAENERLRRRYEAESDRRSQAVTARQAAQEHQNRLEDRIAQLEGELEQAADGHASDLSVRRRERLRGERLEAVLDRLDSLQTGQEGALTVWVEDEPPESAESLLAERAVLVTEAAPCLCCLDDAGLVSITLEPPIEPNSPGIREAHWRDHFQLEREWFRPTGRFTIALVRADLFALGVYDGEERLEFRGFESDVKSSHSKGGFSQGRFERIRDGQIAEHLERCREVIAEYDSEPLYLVGQREAIDAVGVDYDASAVVDATGAPKAALEDAVRSFWTTTLRIV